MSSRGWNSFFAWEELDGESSGIIKNTMSIGVAISISAAFAMLAVPAAVVHVDPSLLPGVLFPGFGVKSVLRGCCGVDATAVNSYTPFSGQKR